jgi:hypothetical protein
LNNNVPFNPTIFGLNFINNVSNFNNINFTQNILNNLFTRKEDSTGSISNPSITKNNEDSPKIFNNNPLINGIYKI